MRGRYYAAVVFVAALVTSGCGTVVNLCKSDSKPLGGVQTDMDFATYYLNGGEKVTGREQQDVYAALGMVALPFFDMPFSFIGDILTYPIVRWKDSS
jgi:uncharacterized protein YceK